MFVHCKYEDTVQIIKTTTREGNINKMSKKIIFIVNDGTSSNLPLSSMKENDPKFWS